MLGGSVHTECYIYKSLAYTIYILFTCILISYINFKVIIAMFYFCHLKSPWNIMKNILNSIYIYILKKEKKKSSTTNMKKKCVIRKLNLYFFDAMKNSQIFPSKVCHFHYNHIFLFRREMGNIRMGKEVRLHKHIKFRLSG